VHTERDPRVNAIPDIHGHAKGEHKPYAEERPLPLTARMLFLWFYHACRRGFPRFMMVTDHMNSLTFEDPASVNLVRRALKLAQAGDLYGAAETANVDVGHAQAVSEGLRRGMRYSIGAEVDNDPRARPDAQNIVEAMRPDGLIRSVHFIPIEHPVHGPNWNWPFDNPEFASLYEHVGTEKTWELYMGVLLDALERLPGNIVGHFYVPAIFGHWPDQATLERYEDQLLDVVERQGMAVEFNTRFLYRDHPAEEKQRYLDANRRLLRKAKDRGIGIAIGSDAHSPRDQGNAFETVLGVLDELEINEIVFPIGGRMLRVALRYVKPPEPEPPPPPPPAPEPPPPVAVVAPLPEVAVAKPVRKARPAASPVRPKADTPERAAQTPFEPAGAEAVAVDIEAGPAAVVPAEPPAPPKVSPKPAAAKATKPKAAAEATPAAAAVDNKPAPAHEAPIKAVSAKPLPAKALPPLKVSAKAPPLKAPAAKVAPGKAVAPAKVAAKAPAGKTAVKAGSAKGAASKAVPVKKAAATSASKRAPLKKNPVKKTAAKKAVVKKAAPKKAAPAKKAAPLKKGPAKKPAAKKAPAKKAAPAAVKRTAAKKAPKPKLAAKKSSAPKPAAKRR
jgi:HisJ family histidinol phosphate phosphatase